MKDPVVDTAAGQVRGMTVAAPPGGRSVHRFLGIPYAAAPVGDLRWRAPQPRDPWPGVREALAFGPSCPQAEPLDAPLPGFRMDVTSEDCLSLNIWTPDPDGARPVMVWIHGGAYTSGGSAQPVYDAARLAADGDVVVATINYRLGALGFLAPEGDADANCGLRDQLAACAWVREHAGAFGGDPRRLTVFGESAGAGSILHLLGSRRRGGAFDRAIVQSGQPRTLTSDEARLVAGALADAIGLSTADAGALRSVESARLVAAQTAATSAALASVGIMPFNPSIDDDLCDATVVDGVRAGRADDVALVIGTTRDELRLFADPGADTLEDERLVRWVGRLVGDDGDPAGTVATYRAEGGVRTTNARIWDAVRTDAMMRVPNLRVADAHAERGSPTFVYRFDWEAPGIGAAHAVDVPFTFGTFDREGWDQAVGADARAEALSVAWRACWTAFAATGNPSLPGAPWPAYEPARRRTMLFAAPGAVVTDDPAATTRRCWR